MVFACLVTAKLQEHKGPMILLEHIWSESNLVNFSIPKVLKTVLSSPELALSDPTMVDAEIKNVPVLCTRFKYW